MKHQLIIALFMLSASFVYGSTLFQNLEVNKEPKPETCNAESLEKSDEKLKTLPLKTYPNYHLKLEKSNDVQGQTVKQSLNERHAQDQNVEQTLNRRHLQDQTVQQLLKKTHQLRPSEPRDKYLYGNGENAGNSQDQKVEQTLGERHRQDQTVNQGIHRRNLQNQDVNQELLKKPQKQYPILLGNDDHSATAPLLKKPQKQYPILLGNDDNSADSGSDSNSHEQKQNANQVMSARSLQEQKVNQALNEAYHKRHQEQKFNHFLKTGHLLDDEEKKELLAAAKNHKVKYLPYYDEENSAEKKHLQNQNVKQLLDVPHRRNLQNQNILQKLKADSSNDAQNQDVNQSMKKKPHHGRYLLDSDEDLPQEDNNGHAYRRSEPLNEESKKKIGSTNSVHNRVSPDHTNSLESYSQVDGKTMVPKPAGSIFCYACSSLSNPTCQKPIPGETTVKICEKGKTCVTKVYNEPGTNQTMMVRDCATSCEEADPNNIFVVKTCTSCSKDYCNSAISVNNKNFFVMCSVLVLIVVKNII